MTFQERLTKYQANIPFFALGIYYLGFALYFLLVLKLHSAFYKKWVLNNGLTVHDSFTDLALSGTQAMADQMPMLCVYGLAFIAFSFIFHKSRLLSMALLLLLSVGIIHWSNNYMDAIIAQSQLIQQQFSHLDIDRTPTFFQKILKSQSIWTQFKAFATVSFPLFIACILSFVVLKPKRAAVPPPLPRV